MTGTTPRVVGSRVVVCLMGLVAVASQRAAAQELRVAVGEREIARVAVSETRGYPALPIDLLEPLGAKVVVGKDVVQVRLFGDTLRFYPGYAEFQIDVRTESLQALTYLQDGTLYVAQWFFTYWLPNHYPWRLTYGDHVLRLTAGAVAASGGSDIAAARAVRESPPAAPAARAARRAPPPADTARSEAVADSLDAERPVTRDRTYDPDEPLGEILGFIDARVSGVYDSNIDHRTAATRSYGTVGRLGVGIQSSPVRPFLMARYDFALYRFANSDQWKRTTHDVSADVAPTFGAVRLRLGAALRLGSWTEDRQPANQIVVRPQIEFRPTPIHLINLYVMQSARRIDVGTTTLRDTFRLAGLGYYLWWHAGGFRVDARYESDKSEYVPSSYDGWTGYAWTRIPFTESFRVTLESAYNRRRYAHSFVDPAHTIMRRDRRWTLTTSFTTLLPTPGWEVSLVYTFEDGRSNSPSAVYRAHRVETMVRRRW